MVSDTVCRAFGSLTQRQPVFQDINGLAVKFFIQKDLPRQVQAELCETITVRLMSVHISSPLKSGYIVAWW
jgi:hypothetical protein